HTKSSLKESGCVASVLKPTSQRGVEALDRQIRAVRRMLSLGRPVGLTTHYEIGERLTIASGPLRGMSGAVTSVGNASRLVLWIDMLGVGAFVELEGDTMLERASVAPPGNASNA